MSEVGVKFKLIHKFISQFKKNYGDEMLIDITGLRGEDIKVQVPDWMSVDQILTKGSTIVFGELPSFEVWFDRSVEPAPLPSYLELFQ